MATLFPEEAIRPKREADPLREEDMLEKVSDYFRAILVFVRYRGEEGEEGEISTHSIVNNILRSSIIIYIHRNASQRRYLC